MKVNINVAATVTLTPYGRGVLRREWAGHVRHDEQIPGLTVANNEYRAPLWEIMRTFGDRIYMGAPQCFVGNDVTLHLND